MEYNVDHLKEFKNEPILKVLKLIEGEKINYDRWSLSGTRYYNIKTEILDSTNPKRPKVSIIVVSPPPQYSRITYPKDIGSLLDCFFSVTGNDEREKEIEKMRENVW